MWSDFQLFALGRAKSKTIEEEKIDWRFSYFNFYETNFKENSGRRKLKKLVCKDNNTCIKDARG